jgi:hypothetical protein
MIVSKDQSLNATSRGFAAGQEFFSFLLYRYAAENFGNQLQSFSEAREPLGVSDEASFEEEPSRAKAPRHKEERIDEKRNR